MSLPADSVQKGEKQRVDTLFLDRCGMACSVSCTGVMMCILKASVKPCSPMWSPVMASVHTPPQFTFTDRTL